MEKKMKSAYELALEKMNSSPGGSRSDRELTHQQKERIAEIRRIYKARRAEVEIMHRSAMMDLNHSNLASTDPAEWVKVRDTREADFRNTLKRFEEEEDREVEQVRTINS